MSPIVLLSDFGHQDGYVGVMKGVISGICPHAQLIDLSHEVPPQDLNVGRFLLWRHYRYFPPGSLFVCVVDPGVGSEREILLTRVGPYLFLTPDNGLLDFVLAEASSIESHAVTHPNLMGPAISFTFHGRDIFAPAAAHIANGFPLEEVGPARYLPIPPSPFLEVESPGKISLAVLSIDHYGNVITNLRLREGQSGKVLLPNLHIPSASTYASAAPGEALALIGSHGLLEIAVRNGSAAESLGLGYGSPIKWEPHPVGGPSHDLAGVIGK
jgi:hypothetical protein